MILVLSVRYNELDPNKSYQVSLKFCLQVVWYPASHHTPWIAFSYRPNTENLGQGLSRLDLKASKCLCAIRIATNLLGMRVSKKRIHLLHPNSCSAKRCKTASSDSCSWGSTEKSSYAFRLVIMCCTGNAVSTEKMSSSRFWMKIKAKLDSQTWRSK